MCITHTHLLTYAAAAKHADMHAGSAEQKTATVVSVA